MIYPLLRNLLFCLPAETSHDLALSGMEWSRRLGLSSLLAVDRDLLRQPRTVMGIEFPNPVGLAAGLDKNAEHIDALHRLGFGFVEVGTLTPRAQPGNPRPRLFRLRQHQAIINRMGFNNKGIEHGVAAVRSRRSNGIVGINIGKNFDTPVAEAAADYLAGMRACYAAADYISVNLSSPNTPGLRDLQFGDQLQRLLQQLKQEQQQLANQHDRYVPLAVKLAPDMNDKDVRACCQAILQQDLDAIIATNTTLDRDTVAEHALAQESGGLSGAPLTRRANDMLRLIKAETGDRVALIGVGGIMTADDALQRLQAGADLLQLYTGFIYHGPQLIADILLRLKAGSAS